MNCSKTMIKVAAGLGVFAFPQAQSLLLANAPLLLVLACPISMGVMMWMMRGSNDTKQSEPADPGTARIPVYVLDKAPGKV